jgi:hypothetical protein
MMKLNHVLFLAAIMLPFFDDASSARLRLSMSSQQPHVAVIGGGWAGWGAAKALCEAGVRVTLLDAIPDPTGKTPYLTPTGKPFEPGHKGFWFDYPNINSLTAELGIKDDDIYSPFTNSSFYSPFGLEATAPGKIL